MNWLGIDGGGTKTACTLYDNELNPVCRTSFSTCHYAQAGYDGMARILQDCVSWGRSHGLRPDAGVGFGICGYGEGTDSDAAIYNAAAAAAGGMPFEVVNDVDAAWASGLMMADGICLIAGTGSIALGVHGARRMRCGGWDYLIGDEGSGGWIGKRTLSAFSRQSDGRDPRGPLYQALKQELELRDDFDIIAFAQQHLADRTRIGALSVLAANAAREGDISAQRIFSEAAAELADHVRALHRALFSGEPEVPVAYIGGIFAAKDLVLEPLAAQLPQGCRLVEPLREPELGPVLILRERLDELREPRR